MTETNLECKNEIIHPIHVVVHSLVWMWDSQAGKGTPMPLLIFSKFSHKILFILGEWPTNDGSCRPEKLYDFNKDINKTI